VLKNLSESRDEIISKARNGKITPEQAEEEAKAAGLPPFERQPTIGEFDPMTESRWPIVMVVAWIAWRDIQLVAQQQPEYRSQSTWWCQREWLEPADGAERITERRGWVLEPWPPSTTLRLRSIDNSLRENGQLSALSRVRPREAETSLWQALSEGLLKAEGFNKNGALVEIPVGEWTHLKLFEEGKQDALKYDALDYDQPYTKVRLRRDDVLGLWPREGGTARSESECRRWLVALMRESPDERPKSKGQFWTDAQEKFRNLLERQFLRAWDAAVKEAPAPRWSNRGRPKTKSNHRTS
jgi:hypothetical protein